MKESNVHYRRHSVHCSARYTAWSYHKRHSTIWCCTKTSMNWQISVLNTAQRLK